ncbi:MAG: ribosomal protein S18-alanine N-acetyltransferase [Clostridia bacterium]|nr:ribosomal protein S18-alanine N-acetyltransferase [Clostridia bacterium]
MSKVIFICTGNTCRSPMAAAVYSRLCPDDEVLSAGLYADGSEYCHKSIAALESIGISLSGNSKQLEPDMLDCDRFYVMSGSHKAALLSVGVADDKITVLNVSDPFGGDLEVYKACLKEIIGKLSALLVAVRPMTEADTETVAELENTCFSEPWSQQGLLDSLGSGIRFAVADIMGRIAGYMGVQVTLDEAYVTNVAVFPEFRRLGIGNKLVQDAIGFCEENDIAFLTLEVRESNAKAISLYENAGFAYVGKRKNFYSNPKEDAVLMTKEFK